MNYIVAPFWANSDTRISGEILYEVHADTSRSESLNAVSQFIRHDHNNRFAGTWMLVTEWREVPEYPATGGSSANVSLLLLLFLPITNLVHNNNMLYFAFHRTHSKES